MKSLLAALFGWGAGKAAQKHMEDNKESIIQKKANKILAKNPDLKKHAEELKKSSDKQTKATDAAIEKVRKEDPERYKRFQKIQNMSEYYRDYYLPTVLGTKL